MSQCVLLSWFCCCRLVVQHSSSYLASTVDPFKLVRFSLLLKRPDYRLLLLGIWRFLSLLFILFFQQNDKCNQRMNITRRTNNPTIGTAQPNERIRFWTRDIAFSTPWIQFETMKNRSCSTVHIQCYKILWLWSLARFSPRCDFRPNDQIKQRQRDSKRERERRKLDTFSLFNNNAWAMDCITAYNPILGSIFMPVMDAKVQTDKNEHDAWNVFKQRQ